MPVSISSNTNAPCSSRSVSALLPCFSERRPYPEPIERLQHLLQLRNLLVGVRIASFQIGDFALQNVCTRGFLGHGQDHGLERINVIGELQIG
jgi:hypothetical protein